ncbi:hypothetical protein B0I32_112269 [Nonomuraea fuscirosea]|uniref:Uncharacterized protein n=1 Tax=Nonomuraea fuscirosea TaxID=1291556 RepID=A0A2T0MVE4_9ACTN|nr:hypothetical protein B0I32_112269 [Nonomuraea fuscirosea]
MSGSCRAGTAGRRRPGSQRIGPHGTGSARYWTGSSSVRPADPDPRVDRVGPKVTKVRQWCRVRVVMSGSRRAGTAGRRRPGSQRIGPHGTGSARYWTGSSSVRPADPDPRVDRVGPKVTKVRRWCRGRTASGSCHVGAAGRRRPGPHPSARTGLDRPVLDWIVFGWAPLTRTPARPRRAGGGEGQVVGWDGWPVVASMVSWRLVPFGVITSDSHTVLPRSVSRLSSVMRPSGTAAVILSAAWA